MHSPRAAVYGDHRYRRGRALALAIVIPLERVEAQEQGQESPIQNLLGGIGPF